MDRNPGGDSFVVIAHGYVKVFFIKQLKVMSSSDKNLEYSE